MKSFPELVAAEVENARRLHPLNYQSLHHGYGVLMEEVEEWWDEMKLKSEKRSKKRLLAEIVQVAAVAQRIAEDRGLLYERKVSGQRSEISANTISPAAASSPEPLRHPQNNNIHIEKLPAAGVSSSM